MRLVVGTQNRDKLKEIKAIFQDTPFELVPLNEFHDVQEVVEEGETLQDNAFLKARYAFELTGLPAIADDTGLEVDALDGAPGVYSSRFAGEHATYEDNVQKLLQELDGVSEEKRSARFRCVVAYVDSDNVFSVEGVCEGNIIEKRAGEGGFGYDPVFYLSEFNKTFAEMSGTEKHAVSHRGIAFRKMAEKLEACFS